MAKNAAAMLCLSTKALCFPVLLISLVYRLPTDAALLCYTYSVNKSESRLSHKVQGQLDEKIFISCNHTNCLPSGDLGEKLKYIQSWETQVDTLKDGIVRVSNQALLMKPENNTIREPFTVQVKQCCWHEADGPSKASCDLHLNGHKVLYLHPSTGKWTEVDPGSMWIKEMLEKNKDLIDFLSKTSLGDCKTWLKEVISKLDFEKKLEPSGLVKDTAGVFISASPAIAPDVDQSSSMTMEPNAFVLLFTLALLVLLKYLQ